LSFSLLGELFSLACELFSSRSFGCCKLFKNSNQRSSFGSFIDMGVEADVNNESLIVDRLKLSA
jgi:hypothetical protein